METATTLQLTAAILRLSLLFSPFSGHKDSLVSSRKSVSISAVFRGGVTLLQQIRSSKITIFLKEAADRDVGNRSALGFSSGYRHPLNTHGLAVAHPNVTTSWIQPHL